MRRVHRWAAGGVAAGLGLLAVAGCEEDPGALAQLGGIAAGGAPTPPYQRSLGAGGSVFLGEIPDADTPDAEASLDADAGEVCAETGPTLCPPLGCLLRELAGGGTCTATCVASGEQTLCQSGDACCPSGCTPDDDADCGPDACGNGIVEDGETCDPISSCPTSCPPIGCMRQRLEGEGTCATRCVDAEPQTACADADGCCPEGCDATTDSDCAP